MGRTVPSRSFNCKKMSSKTKNLIVRTITGVLFIAIMVSGFLRPQAMVFLFSLITGLTIWEYCSLVNELKTVTVNRFIATVAGVYFFLAVAGINSGYIQTNGVFVPYLLTIVYLFVSELYTRNENAIHDWAYTMLSQMYINDQRFGIPTGPRRRHTLLLSPAAQRVYLSVDERHRCLLQWFVVGQTQAISTYLTC